MKRILVFLILLATFASAQQADSTDILITVREDGDTLQTGRWRSGMPVRIRDSWNGWGERERLANKFVIVRVGVDKSRIDSFLVAHSDSTTGLRRKYQLSRSAIQFVKNNRDAHNVVRVTPAQLRNAFKRANRLRRFSEPQRMGILTPDLFVLWRNMLIAATETSVTVNTDGGGDYTSLAAAEAGEQKDLVSANEQLTINCSGTTADVAAVTFAGWTFDATRFPVIQGNWDGAVWDNSKYRLQASLETQVALHITSLQAELLTGGGTLIYYNATNGSIDKSILRHFPNSSGAKCFFSTGAANVSITNSIIYLEGSGLSGIAAINNTSSSAAILVYNVTIPKVLNSTGAATGIYSSHANKVTAKNVLIQNTNDPFLGTFLGDYNCSDTSDAQKPGANSITATVDFADAANGNFSLSAESPGIDQGGDLTAEGITTDIKGVTRPQGAAFDIGAFEFVPTGESTIEKKNGWNGWLNKGFKGRY